METPERRFERTWQPRLWLSLGLLILIVAYVIAFVIANDDEARISFVFADARTSLIWVILLSLLAGLIAGVLLSQLHRRRQASLRESYTSEASSETPSSIADGDS
ncbi:MAG: LapA family protein [Actinobacteria bacterium]|nr:LapA family protein [Actinomycetota bacterium]